MWRREREFKFQWNRVGEHYELMWANLVGVKTHQARRKKNLLQCAQFSNVNRNQIGFIWEKQSAALLLCFFLRKIEGLLKGLWAWLSCVLRFSLLWSEIEWIEEKKVECRKAYHSETTTTRVQWTRGERASIRAGESKVPMTNKITRQHPPRPSPLFLDLQMIHKSLLFWALLHNALT